jgi:hypothetical protein
MDIKTLLDRPIAFHRAFVTLTGSVTAALMLSQAVYWSRRVAEGRDGWFYKTQDEWQEETGLSRSEQETARKKLKKYLHCERRGMPAQLYYRVNEDALYADLIAGKPQTRLQESCKQDCENPADINRSQETTPEITHACAEIENKQPLHIDNFPAALRQPLTWFWELFRVPIPAARRGREYERWKIGLTNLAEISARHGRLAFERTYAEWRRLKFQVGHPGALENTMRAVVGELERAATLRAENPPDEPEPERSPEEIAEIQRQAEEARQRLQKLQQKGSNP